MMDANSVGLTKLKVSCRMTPDARVAQQALRMMELLTGYLTGVCADVSRTARRRMSR